MPLGAHLELSKQYFLPLVSLLFYLYLLIQPLRNLSRMWGSRTEYHVVHVASPLIATTRQTWKIYRPSDPILCPTLSVCLKWIPFMIEALPNQGVHLIISSEHRNGYCSIHINQTELINELLKDSVHQCYECGGAIFESHWQN